MDHGKWQSCLQSNKKKVSPQWVKLDGKDIFISSLTKLNESGCRWVTVRSGARICILPKKAGAWKPVGSKDEAEAFVEDSKVQSDIYHGTSQDSANAIKNKGFVAGEADAFGKGVYFTSDTGLATKYARINSKSGKGAVLKTKLKTKNPYVRSLDAFTKEADKFGQTKSSYTKFINKIKKKHDSIIIERPQDINYYVVFDKRNLMIHE